MAGNPSQRKREIDLMGISRVPDQIKRAPAGALRAVFSGIGRILLAADRPGPPPARLRSDADSAPPGPAEQAVAQQRAEPPRPTTESRWRSLDQTGNVRLLTADEIYDDTKPDVSDGTDGGRSATRTPARTEDAAQAGSGAASARPAASPLTLPLADYDSLSLPSIRARLRVLSPDQLRVLADYERKNAERTDVLGMLERRIEKVENAR
jgi:hypothetical protein